MPDISVALGLLKKPIEAMAGIASGKAKDALTKIKAERNVKLIHQKLSAIQKVKTIWNVDRALMISSFYYPAAIKSSNNQTQQLDSLDDLPANHVVLQGTVGQGKSILLRWLVGKEVRSGKRLPVFIELRRVPVGGFEDFVIKVFSDLVGVAEDSTLFQVFAENGRVSLLLDGFDELDPENVTAIATSVERLAQLYPQTRIVITSRPDSGMENSPLFDVIPIAKLTPLTLPQFFSKILSRDKELAARLIAATKTSPSIANLVSTPLLATLLTIVYRAHQKIPLDFSDFYEELFQILLVRHDKSKIGYERHRRTKLGDKQMQELFEAFCYKTKAKSKTSIEKSEALEIAKLSSESVQIACEEASFLEDIKKITCLLSEEGSRIEFLHQSVQEFFAARYIRSRPDSVAKRFYNQILETKKWQVWQQELEFLGQIDRYRSSKYFFMPALEATLEMLGANGGRPSSANLRASLSDLISVRQEVLGPDQKPISVPKYYIHHLEKRTSYLIGTFDSRMFGLLFASADWRKAFDATSHRQQLTYTQIAEFCQLGSKLDELLEGTFDYLQSQLRDYRESVRAFDDSAKFLDI